jgi:ribosomal protein L40E
MFTLVPIFIFVVFAIVIISIIVRVAKGLSDWNYNNNQPMLSERASLVSKRTHVHGSHKHSATTYYATFELPGGARREFQVNGSEFGLLAEGDAGELRYQGGRYLGFDRAPSATAAEPVTAPGPSLVCDYCATTNPAGASKCANCGSSRLSPQSTEAESL